MKTLSVTRMISLLTLLVCLPINAEMIELDGLYYGISGDDASVQSNGGMFYEGTYKGDIVIPDQITYNGKTYNVTSIGYKAFHECWELTSIVIPNSVTSIGEKAFYYCSGLTSVTIPNSVTSIGNFVFGRCSGLTSVISEIQNPFQIYDYVFDSDIYANVTLTVPTGTKAKYQSTDGWKKFKNIVEAGNSEKPKKQTIHVATAGTLPDLISESAREVIEELTLTGEINGTDLKLIREMAGCPYKRDADGWLKYHSGEKLSFLDLSGVKIKAGGEDYYYEEGDNRDIYMYIDNNDELPSYAFYCSKLTSFIAPGNVKKIGMCAFNECSNLRSISNLSSVTSVGSHAFGNCSSLPLVAIPSNVKTIEDGAFTYCTGITSVTFSNNVTSIGNSAFYGCSHLTSIYFPNMATSIGSRAFSECTSLTTITSEIEAPSSFDDDVFSSATYSNVTLTVPKGKKSLYQSTAGWSNFKNIVEAGGGQGDEIGKTFEFDGIYYWIVDDNSVGVQSGYRCQGDVVIPSQVSYNGKTYNVIYIGVEAFSDCRITSIIIPNSVTMISGMAFVNCSDLISVTIPNSVTTIYEEAFWGCSSLSSITIPNSVTTIGHGAFEGCSSLTSITIPGSVTSIGGGAFSDCSDLTSIKVESGNSVYDSRDNCNAIIETTSNTLIAGCKNTTIPNSVTSIGNYAFFLCGGLTSITIPGSVTSIGICAFNGCRGLTSVTIPGSVTNMGWGAFSGCTGLTSVISEIKNPFSISDDVFESSYTNATLTVPTGTKAAYQSTDGWKLFQNIVEAAGNEVEFIIDGVTYQGSKSEKTVMVKAVNTSLNSVEVSASVSYDGTSYTVTGIADNAFAGCTLAALIWEPDVALSNNAFNNASIGSNFLLYVKSASYAPSSIKNVVVNGKASSITLSDNGGGFYCPQAFTAEKISYTHYYSMETGGDGKGWETIALPFGVETISHATRGEIVPFAAYSQNSGKKPFWLCKFGSNGFIRANYIQAYTPYIIAMPNQSSYNNDYILAGEVTFSSENVNVAATPTFSGTFIPVFSTVPQSSNVYALNVVNRYVSQTGGYDAGSKFISNLRDVRPFEAYISPSSSTRGIYDINMEDGTTSMDGVLSLLNPDREIDIYTLSGQKIKRVKQCDLNDVIDQLPHGVYIINGQKVLH